MDLDLLDVYNSFLPKPHYITLYSESYNDQYLIRQFKKEYPHKKFYTNNQYYLTNLIIFAVEKNMKINLRLEDQIVWGHLVTKYLKNEMEDSDNYFYPFASCIGIIEKCFLISL